MGGQEQPFELVRQGAIKAEDPPLIPQNLGGSCFVGSGVGGGFRNSFEGGRGRGLHSFHFRST